MYALQNAYCFVVVGNVSTVHNKELFLLREALLKMPCHEDKILTKSKKTSAKDAPFWFVSRRLRQKF